MLGWRARGAHLSKYTWKCRAGLTERVSAMTGSTTREREELLASEVARLYFERQLSKVAIGARLGVSRFRVARLIDRALEMGLVQIVFSERVLFDHELARQIETRFGLRLCIVARDCDAATAEGLRHLGGVGASIVADLISPSETIGVSWGATIAAFAARLPYRDSSGVHVVQLAGGSGRLRGHQNASEVARLVADRLGATFHPLYAPAAVRTPSLRDHLLREPDIQATTRLWDRISLALTGIGALGDSPAGTGPAVLTKVFDSSSLDSLRRAGAVAELMLTAIAEDGSSVVEGGIPIAITLDQLRRAERTVAIAGGVCKSRAITAALRSGVIDILITDDAAARTMIAADPTAPDAGERASKAWQRDRGLAPGRSSAGAAIAHVSVVCSNGDQRSTVSAIDGLAATGGM